MSYDCRYEKPLMIQRGDERRAVTEEYWQDADRWDYPGAAV